VLSVYILTAMNQIEQIKFLIQVSRS